MAGLPAAEKVTLAQCGFGCAYAKPTTFLTIHAPTLGRRVRALPGRGACQHRGGHRSAIGRDGEGGFNTASLKTYPPLLCKLLAECLWCDFQSWTPEGVCSHEVPQDAKGFYILLDPYFNFQMSHDCARHVRARGGG